MSLSEVFVRCVAQLPFDIGDAVITRVYFEYTAALCVQLCRLPSEVERKKLLSDREELYNDLSKADDTDAFTTKFDELHQGKADISRCGDYIKILSHLRDHQLSAFQLLTFVGYCSARHSVVAYSAARLKALRRWKKAQRAACWDLPEDSDSAELVEAQVEEKINAQLMLFQRLFIQQMMPACNVIALVYFIINHCDNLYSVPTAPFKVDGTWMQTRDDQYNAFLAQWREAGSLLKVIRPPPLVPTPPAEDENSGEEALLTTPSSAPGTESDGGGGNNLGSVGTQGQGGVDVNGPQSLASAPSTLGSSVLFAPVSAATSAGGSALEVPGEADDAAVMDCAGASVGSSGEAPDVGVFDESRSRRLLDNFKTSRFPLQTDFGRLLRDTIEKANNATDDSVPNMDIEALFPSETPEGRVGFREGFTRLAPWCAMEEAQEVLHLLMADLTCTAEVTDDDTTETLPTADTCVSAAAATHDESSNCLRRASFREGILTLLVNDTTMRLQISNPLAIPDAPVEMSFQCDTCCQLGIWVAYQAVVYDGVRSSFIHNGDCIGFDVCLACVVYFYKAALVRLMDALHPSPQLRRPFLHGRDTRLVIWSMCAREDGVEMVVGVSPLGSRPLAWQADADDPDWARAVSEATSFCDTEISPHRCCAAESQERYVRFDRRLLQHLPIPGASGVNDGDNAAEASTVVFEGIDKSRLHDDSTCCVCLEPLRLGPGEEPLFETTCHHLFHRNCISSVFHAKSIAIQPTQDDPDRAVHSSCCPLCRSTDFMPPENDVQYNVNKNLFRIFLPLRHDANTSVSGKTLVGLAAVISEDGRYYNPTNVIACNLLEIFPGQLRAYEECDP